MAMKCAPRMMNYCGKMASHDMYGQYNLGSAYGGAQQYYNQQSITLQRGLNTHNNFLAKVGHLTPNLNKTISLKLPTGYYHLLVHAFTPHASLRREYSIPNP